MSFKAILNAGYILLLGIILVLCLFSFSNFYKIEKSLNSVITFETPVKKRVERITRILTETNNSFELYIHREKVEYSDVLNHMDHLIDRSIALEHYLDEKQYISDYFTQIRVFIINMKIVSVHVDSDLKDMLRDLIQQRFTHAYQQLFYLKRHLKKIPEEQKLSAMNLYMIVNRIFRETLHTYELLVNKSITFNDVITPLERVVEECKVLMLLVGKAEKRAIFILSTHITQLRHHIINYVTQEKVLDNTSDTLQQMRKSVLNIREDVHKSLCEMQQRVDDRIEKNQNNMFNLIDEIQWLMILGMIAAIIISIMTVVISRRALMRPISQLMNATQKLATGDLTFRVNIATKDEIGKLAIALNQMAEDLQYITVSRDKLKETQAQLVQASKLASIGELASGIAHELNQPLMVIDTGIQLISRSIKKNRLDKNNLSDDMKLFSRNTKRMMRIINHLRTFSRQSEDKLFESINILQVIEDALSMISEQFRLKNINIIKVFPKNVPDVKGNANQLEQVFINLFTNARDAILEKNDSKGEIGIKVAHEKSQPAINVHIKDTGCGISSKAIQRIFDPFFTTKDVGKGTGLGLSISYGIIKEHYGDIVVSETGHNGTIFVVSLPIQE
jgi:C4-dicarboxylate-specific signal transduction histidine kinase